MVVIYVISIFFQIFCASSAFILRTSFSEQGNELDVYKRYLDLSSNEKHNDVFLRSNCPSKQPDQGLISECNTNMFPSIKKIFQPLWKPPPIHENNNPQKKIIDCQYRLLDTSDISFDKKDGLRITFSIIQYDCISQSKRGISILGGSSFDILASNSIFLSSCGVIDNFNNTYHVKCHLPVSFHHYNVNPKALTTTLTNSKKAFSNTTTLIINNNTAIKNTDYHFCMKINVTLEFEHYTAYETYQIDDTLVLRHPIAINHLFCHLQEENLNQHIQIKSVDTTTMTTNTNNITNKMKQNKKESFQNESLSYDLSKNIKIIRGVWLLKNDSKAIWESAEGGLRLSKSDFQSCLRKQMNNYIGESHQRYTWTHIVYHYLDAQRTYLAASEKKHGDIKFENISFTLKYFYPTIASYLNTIPCPNSGEKLSISVQSGTWDLSFTPLQNILLNPAYIDAMMSSIEKLMSRPCAKDIHFVLVQSMPYPKCNLNDGMCLSQQSWKRNPAILAMHQYIQQKLIKLTNSYDSSHPISTNIQLIDTSQIMRTYRHESDCINHFLCRHGGRQNFRVATTQAGMALAAEITRAMCDNMF